MKFHFKINDGKTQKFKVNTEIYVEAVAAIPAHIGDIEYPVKIEIWVEDLLPDYGPYFYQIKSPGGHVGIWIA